MTRRYTPEYQKEIDRLKSGVEEKEEVVEEKKEDDNVARFAKEIEEEEKGVEKEEEKGVEKEEKKEEPKAPKPAMKWGTIKKQEVKGIDEINKELESSRV